MTAPQFYSDIIPVLEGLPLAPGESELSVHEFQGFSTT